MELPGAAPACACGDFSTNPDATVLTWTILSCLHFSPFVNHFLEASGIIMFFEESALCLTIATFVDVPLLNSIISPPYSAQFISF